MNRRKKIIFMILCGMVMAALIFGCSHKEAKTEQTPVQKKSENTAAQVKNSTLYRCPMHPNITSDKPGKCPICGMDLVPVEQQETKPSVKKKTMYRSTMNPQEISDKPGKDSMGMEMERYEVEETSQEQKISGSAAVKISHEKQQLIGVRTGIVKKVPFHKTIRAVGKVDYIEPLQAYVNTKFEGYVNKLHVDSTGQYVKKGQPLLEVYSPELLATQNEYMLAVKNKKALEQSNMSDAIQNATSLLETGRQRLKLWDISDAQIDKIEKTGEVTKTLTFYAPISGYVIEKNVLQGQRIMPGDNLYKIADISKVWIYGQVYEYELSLIKLGQEVNITFVAYPGEIFKGTLSYIYPYLSEDTRTIKVRIESANPGLKMKPEMYANLEIDVDLGSRLAVPVDAVLDSGEKKIIFIDKGNGYIEPRKVKIGLSANNMYEIIDGVAEGEKIITSAQFLIDSESSLNAALEAMSEK